VTLGLLVALTACGDDAVAPDAVAPDGGRSDAGGDASVELDSGSDSGATDGGTGGWESVETTTDDGAIVIERVTYRSGGLRIFGQVCRPARPGPHPLLIVNHGGFEGIGAGEWNGGVCANVARMAGWVVAQSSYRGEDGSEGPIEVCLGEVDDVLEMTRIMRSQPYVDPDRIAMTGGSHGGCITLRAIERGAEVALAAALVPATDFAGLHDYWTSSLAGGEGTPAQETVWRGLRDIVEAATGGTPETMPDAYRARSPALFGPELEAFDGPILILGGMTDYLTPYMQQCAMAAAMPGVRAYRVTDATGATTTTAPPGCEGVEFLAGPRAAPSWPDDRYFVLYDDAGHDLGAGTPLGETIGGDWVGFLVARMPP
jgi:acetyl esterase/lipase